MDLVEQRVCLDHLAGMGLTDRRVKWAELELPVAKVILVTRGQAASPEILVKVAHQGRKEERVTPASLGGQVSLGPQVIPGQRVKKEILGIRGYQERRGLRGLRVHLDERANRGEEDYLDQRAQKDLTDKKEEKEN